MSGLFQGKNTVRLRYADLDETEINATTDISDVKLLHTFSHTSRIVLFDNSHDVDLAIYARNPEGDKKVFLFELPALRPLNFDISGTLGLAVEAGTEIWVHKLAGSASASGKLRLIAWG